MSKANNSYKESYLKLKKKNKQSKNKFLILICAVLILIVIIGIYFLTSNPNQSIWKSTDPFEYIDGQLQFQLPTNWKYNQNLSQVKTTSTENKDMNSIYYESELIENSNTIAKLEGIYQQYDIIGMNYAVSRNIFDKQFPNAINKGKTDATNSAVQLNYLDFGTLNNIDQDSTLSFEYPLFARWYNSIDPTQNTSRFALEFILDKGFLTLNITGTDDTYKIDKDFIDKLNKSFYFTKSSL